MTTRKVLLTTLAAGALAVSAFGVAGPASAAAADPEECTITDVTPYRVVIGIEPKSVQFDVKTDCDDTLDMKWGVLGALLPGANHPGWFGACIFSYAGPNSYDCAHGGATVLDPINHGSKKGNANAGLNIEYAYAFNDANGDSRDNDSSSRVYETTQFRLLRESTWSSSFNASPEPRRAGKKLHLNAQFSVADWDTAQFAATDATATLQFRQTRSDDWKAVKKVKVSQGVVDATTTAKSSGYYRLRYAGTETQAPSTSNVDYVKVLPKRG